MREDGTLRVRRFTEDEASVECVAGWDLHCVQMSSGVLAGESVDLQLPGLQLLFEAFRNVSTSHCGTAPAGAVVFGIARSMAGIGRFNGQPWQGGVTAFDSRQELVSVVPPAELITLVVDRQRLTEHVWATCHVDLGRWPSEPVMLPGDALARRLTRHLLAIRSACLQAGDRISGAATQQQMADELLELLTPLVVQRLGGTPDARPRGSHAALVRRAREHVLARADETLRIADLCRALGVSRRWLQWSFNEVLGTGPCHYLQLMRLTGARRMLQHAPPGRRVTDAVEAYGFWHLSRFSRDYRRHFGELPSQTLQRALARG